MARKRIPKHLQETPTDPKHLGMPRNVRIGKREYRIAEPADIASLPDYIPNTLYRTRPLIFNTVQEFINSATEYVNKAIELHKPVTYTGLCCFLGTYRAALDSKYANDIEFSNAISNVKSIIEDNLLENSLKGEYQHQIATLILKNMHSYKDKVEITSSSVNLNMSQDRESIIEAVEQARKDKAARMSGNSIRQGNEHNLADGEDVSPGENDINCPVLEGESTPLDNDNDTDDSDGESAL